MSLKKTPFVVGSALLVAFLLNLSGCRKAVNPWDTVEGNPPRVLVTFPPLYCFTKNVAGDDAAVLCLRTTIGPHDFKPDADDAFAARYADLFLASGLNLDDFVTNIANSSRNRNTDFVHKVADEAISEKNRIPLGEHDHFHPEGEECTHGEFDPHVWLGIDEAVLMVNHICKLLQEKNPAKADAYRERADKYVAELKALQEEGKKLFADKKNRNFIANHDSFRYFARSFGLNYVDAIQVRPGIEADAGQMQKLINLCKDTDEAKCVRVIAVEPQYKRSSAETLQNTLKNQGIEVTIVTLDPLETVTLDELSLGFYVERMRKNLHTLAEQLR